MIRKSIPLLALWLLATAALLAFIWGNSLMPADESSQLSGWVGQLIGKLFPFFSPDNPDGMHLLRKCAHFCEFAALGMVQCFGWAMLQRKWPRVLLPALGCGMAAAAIDETIQLFADGRYGCIPDFLLDSSGVLTGATCMLLILIIRNRRKAP